ncbi:hypothetical protein MFUR16E_12675 [Methylobacterium fujisawaense]
MFTLDPATYVGEPGPAADGEEWDDAGYKWFLRFGACPFPGKVDRVSEGGLCFEADSPDRYDCEGHRSYCADVLAAWEPGTRSASGSAGTCL